VAIALHQQTVAFDVGEACAFLPLLAKQVTGRIVGKALWQIAPNSYQSIQRVVMEVLVALAGVFDRSEIAVGIVGIATLIDAALLLADAVGLEAALLVIVIMTKQCTLLAVLLTSAR